MPRIVVQTDDGQTIETIEYPIGMEYATYMWPSCPGNVTVQRVLGQIKRAIDDACVVQREGRRPERLSELVMRRVQEEMQRS